MSEERKNPLADEELRAAQAAEEAKGDPGAAEVEPAAIEVAAGERDEPFEKLAAHARRLSPERARTAVETVLFLAERPVGLDEIRAATGLEPARIRDALERLSGHYRAGASGVVLQEVAGGWQLRSAPDNADFARRFLRVKPQRLTRAALETLAIVAYRQPATRPEVEEVRGVDSGAVLKALLERKLVRILGRKEEPGRPILYGTTREFLEFFALKDLASLPTLREFRELSEEHREVLERERPGAEPPHLEGIVAELADPALRAALEARRVEGDAALRDLEAAIRQADDAGRAAEEALRPAQAPPGGGGEGEAPEGGGGPPPGGGPER
ncbi:MAG TPA: SMC-Scp complex subunit ScpB [Anaeromyxobacteraceae bacterium]